jgi:hypothetical protein
MHRSHLLEDHCSKSYVSLEREREVRKRDRERERDRETKREKWRQTEK